MHDLRSSLSGISRRSLALLAVWALLVCSAYAGESAVPAVPADPGGVVYAGGWNDPAPMKARTNFDEWEGTVRLVGKKIEKVPFSEKDLLQFGGDFARVNRTRDKFQFLDVAGHVVFGVDILLYNTPAEAHEALMGSEALTNAALMMPVVRGSALDIGDHATFNMAKSSQAWEIGKRYSTEDLLMLQKGTCLMNFSRNNVTVCIYERGKNSQRLLDVARFADGKLVAALKPTDDPAFSNKLEDPPAEGEAQSESEEQEPTG